MEQISIWQPTTTTTSKTNLYEGSTDDPQTSKESKRSTYFVDEELEREVKKLKLKKKQIEKEQRKLCQEQLIPNLNDFLDTFAAKPIKPIKRRVAVKKKAFSEGDIGVEERLGGALLNRVSKVGEIEKVLTKLNMECKTYRNSSQKRVDELLKLHTEVKKQLTSEIQMERRALQKLSKLNRLKSGNEKPVQVSSSGGSPTVSPTSVIEKIYRRNRCATATNGETQNNTVDNRKCICLMEEKIKEIFEDHPFENSHVSLNQMARNLKLGIENKRNILKLLNKTVFKESKRYGPQNKATKPTPTQQQTQKKLKFKRQKKAHNQLKTSIQQETEIQHLCQMLNNVVTTAMSTINALGSMKPGGTTRRRSARKGVLLQEDIKRQSDESNQAF